MIQLQQRTDKESAAKFRKRFETELDARLKKTLYYGTMPDFRLPIHTIIRLKIVWWFHGKVHRKSGAGILVSMMHSRQSGRFGWVSLPHTIVWVAIVWHVRRVARADSKRKRETSDSYKLFLDDEMATSPSWTIDDAICQRITTPWTVNFNRTNMRQTN